MKVKSAIESENPETARIHAANSIFKRNEAMRFLELKSRLDILTAQVDSAIRTQRVFQYYFYSLLFYVFYLNTGKCCFS